MSHAIKSVYFIILGFFAHLTLQCSDEYIMVMYCVLVVAESGMSRTHADARSFVTRGVDVMSVSEFVRGFVGQAVMLEPQSHPGDFNQL